MNLKDQMNPNGVAFAPQELGQLSWDQLNEGAFALAEEDRLWQQAQGAGMQLAGLFGRSDVMSPQAHKAYKEAAGDSLWGGSLQEVKSPRGPDYSGARGGPQGTVVKSQDELRSQAEMLVRGGRVGTVQKAMEAIKADWTARGYEVK